MIRPDQAPKQEIPEINSEPPLRGTPLYELVKKESSLFDADTIKALSLILEQNPHLKHVEVIKISPEEEPDTGGYFHRVKIDENTFIPSISIVSKNAEHMERILETRKASAQRVADMLEINFSDLTPDLLKQFIISHELGHASDYVKNYETNPKNQNGDAAEEWQLHYEANLLNMPVPGFDPVDLRHEISYFDNLDQFLEVYPNTRTAYNGKKITTFPDLMQAQEQAYRDSAYESYADNFATNFLKRNKKELEQTMEVRLVA